MQVLERALSNMSTHSDDVKGSDDTPLSPTSNQNQVALLRKRKRSRRTTHKSEGTNALSTATTESKMKTKRKEALLVEESMEQGAVGLYEVFLMNILKVQILQDVVRHRAINRCNTLSLDHSKHLK